MTPFTYTNERSLEVVNETIEFVRVNKLEETISDLGWVSYYLDRLIPTPIDAIFGGTFFPCVESWEEIQISWNLCQQGFYKQALASLRSASEVGLLSVYWNLNDDGHLIIQEWLHSKNDTPRYSEVWKKLSRHKNFASSEKFVGSYRHR